MTLTKTPARQVTATDAVVYGRRILAEAAALIRDGQLGGTPEGLSTHEATVIRAELARWFDFLARILKDPRPK